MSKHFGLAAGDGGGDGGGGGSGGGLESDLELTNRHNSTHVYEGIAVIAVFLLAS